MAGLSATVLALIVAAAFFTGVLHGAVGLAGGIVMAAILSHIIGIKVAVPVMTIALVISHLSRAYLFRRDIERSVAARVLIFGLPTTAIGSLIFSVISPRTIAVIFSLFLIVSIPVKWWAARHSVRTGPKLLAGASMVWGLLAGNVIGPGFFLAPFLLGTGMNRLSFVGTVAIVTLAMNLVKLTVFGATGLVTLEYFLLGGLIGIATIPGNWAGRAIVRRVDDRDHGRMVDVLTLLLIANFVYLSLGNL